MARRPRYGRERKRTTRVISMEIGVTWNTVVQLRSAVTSLLMIGLSSRLRLELRQRASSLVFWCL